MVKTKKVEYNNIRGDVIMYAIFNVIVRPCTDTAGYWAVCEMPDGGCTAQGATICEIQKNMIESVSFYLEDYPEISDYYLNFEVNHA